MKQSGFLQKQAALRKASFHAGFCTGIQYSMDLFALAVRETEGFGKVRFGRICEKVKELDHELGGVLTGSSEADYLATKMDEALKECIPDDIYEPFEKRYPYLKDNKL